MVIWMRKSIQSNLKVLSYLAKKRKFGDSIKHCMVLSELVSEFNMVDSNYCYFLFLIFHFLFFSFLFYFQRLRVRVNMTLLSHDHMLHKKSIEGSGRMMSYNIFNTQLFRVGQKQLVWTMKFQYIRKTILYRVLY